MQRAFSKLHVSARYHKLSYKKGESFTGDIFVHEEDFEGRVNAGAICIISVQIVDIAGEQLHEQLFTGAIGEFNRYAGTVEWPVTETENNIFMLRVELEMADEHVPLSSTTYVYTVNSDQPLAPLRHAPKVIIELLTGDQPGTIVVANRSGTSAFGVLIQERNPEEFVNFDRNDLILLPGEEVLVTCSDHLISRDRLMVSGINIYDN